MTTKTRERVIAAEKPEDVKGKCYFCGKEVNGEYFCFGCNHFVCEECEDYPADERPGGPGGKHRVEDHKRD